MSFPQGHLLNCARCFCEGATRRLDVRQHTYSQPLAECAARLVAAMHFQSSLSHAGREGQVAPPDSDEIRQRDCDEELRLTIRILQAKLAMAVLVEKPPA